jgi:hypothetical protein
VIYCTWTCVHYLSAHAYTVYCVPFSLLGFTMSPLITATPHCRALRWCLNNGVSAIDNMWLTLGTWVIGRLGNFM